jgi:predicted dehydrogenase
MAKSESKPKTATSDDYAVLAGEKQAVQAPQLDYRPPHPKRYTPRIGLIGCGGITAHHLTAYRKAGWEVVAFADLDRSRAEARREEYYPDADVYEAADDLLDREDIDVVDIATHPAERAELIERAIAAGKHVLSQKPFVTDLQRGRKMVEAARQAGVRLAVNQNGRWAPHVAYMRQAIGNGLIGELVSVDLAVHWNHNWCAGTPFDRIPHLVLYDFAIHWFDMLHCYTAGLEPGEVYARTAHTRSQKTRPPLLTHAAVEFDHAQASLVFRADSTVGSRDRSVIVGSKGMLVSEGPDLNHQTVTLYTEQGEASPALEGQWFDAGFEGTMGELLCAIEEEREPSNSGADNLHALALCYAAMASAEQGRPVRADAVERMEEAWVQYPS